MNPKQKHKKPKRVVKLIIDGKIMRLKKDYTVSEDGYIILRTPYKPIRNEKMTFKIEV